MARRVLTPFVNELRTMTSEDNSWTDPADRPILFELANDPIIEQVWAAIEKLCGPQMRVVMRFFIRDMLGARRHAMAADDLPDYLTNAKKADDVASFLKSSRHVIPLTAFKEIADAVPALESIASRLREFNDSQRVHVSRQNINGSRQVILFTRMMSLQMMDLFGRPLDGQVAELTNILFPTAHVTLDSVRAGRRPTTKRGRAAKQ